MTRAEIAKALRGIVAHKPELYWADKAALEFAAAEFDGAHHDPKLVEELLVYVEQGRAGYMAADMAERVRRALKP